MRKALNIHEANGELQRSNDKFAQEKEAMTEENNLLKTKVSELNENVRALSDELHKL